MTNTTSKKYDLISGCESNCVIIVDFTLHSDMKIFSSIFREEIEGGEVYLNIFKCSNSGELDYQLDRIVQFVKSKKAKPMIVFDGHGVENGLYFGEKDYDPELSYRTGRVKYEDVYPWVKLWHRMREINIATANNLILLFATCYGANLFKVKFDILTPPACYFAVAPQKEIKARVLKDSYSRFMKTLLGGDSFDSASKQISSDQFSEFHPEMIFCVVAANISDQLKGKKRRRWIEDFLTGFKFKFPFDGDFNKAELRSLFKSYTGDRNRIFQKMKNQFLMAGDSQNESRFNYSIDDVDNAFSQLINKL